MSTRDLDHSLQRALQEADLAMRDGAYVATIVPLLGRLMKLYFRSEVRGFEAIPPEGGALIVSNHSGGLMPMDVPILAAAFVEEFGPDRPLYVLAHDMLFTGAAGPVMRRCGFMPATRENAAAILDSGAVTILFPGGDHDVFRPSSAKNTIDFAGRTGYVRTALRSGVPIVPVVSIGGHEDQLHLWRGEIIAKLLRLESLLRTKYFPISFGFPFGLTAAFPPNLPLPTKIVTEVLEPVDVVAQFGEDPDVAEVDVEIRRRMQDALDQLARERRFPVIG
ncbi:lysophospholipid acyltransferase family protein [Nocardioides sp.]|uniref:lysophospholipid acyltransferase family protein n=1 Tax=Nocardioides sp. TaxID=35761 RepID=UPI00261A20AF|nr:lysophospholipid acyltransferase family protein [Nocardioides sp.]